MSAAMLAACAVAAVAGAMPLLLAALGETVGEQAGVLNVGLEGVLLVGAFAGFATALGTGSAWAGYAAGALAGAALAALLAALSVGLGAHQIVVGIGLALAGTGITSLAYDRWYADARPRLGDPGAWIVPGLSDLPVVGPALFAQPGVLWVGIALAAATGWWLHRSAPGLRLRAAGRAPAAVEAAGWSALRIRALAVLFGGATAGLGGAYLSIVAAGTFTPGMTHGLGFLAIVVAMLGAGRVRVVALVSAAYGACVAAGTALQLVGIAVPSDVIEMAPFVAVLAVLVLLGRRLELPPALAVAYERGLSPRAGR